jgi:hypothetical protein
MTIGPTLSRPTLQRSLSRSDAPRSTPLRPRTLRTHPNLTERQKFYFRMRKPGQIRSKTVKFTLRRSHAPTLPPSSTPGSSRSSTHQLQIAPGSSRSRLRKTAAPGTYRDLPGAIGQKNYFSRKNSGQIRSTNGKVPNSRTIPPFPGSSTINPSILESIYPPKTRVQI